MEPRDVSTPVEYSRQYRLEGAAEGLAALHELISDFYAELNRRVRNREDDISPRDRDYDLRGLAERLGFHPPDRVRPWDIAVGHEAGQTVLVWHDWTQEWPVTASRKALADLAEAASELDSVGLAFHARTAGLTPPFRPDLDWSIGYGERPTEFGWIPPYDHALRIG
ncbi:hypothetical protein LX16_2181 [Stackebrandtia albiflava]|uniref:Uncharacterized protein n=1 Tax=Stackebrandtia albiflava TaxID=406432 RepID=A0A562V0M9_9ACTN|nr:hypothetical protein [Stackebrandtia albiflava]TWJ11459.1 hypothetical protein LX16_2181 [Stackebrandtia albiflava]